MTLEEYVEQAGGKPFVVCMDKFCYEDYLCDTYDSTEQALTAVKNYIQETTKNKEYDNLSLIYHAYDSKGRCIDKEIYGANSQNTGGGKNE